MAEAQDDWESARDHWLAMVDDNNGPGLLVRQMVLHVEEHRRQYEEDCQRCALVLFVPGCWLSLNLHFELMFVNSQTLSTRLWRLHTWFLDWKCSLLYYCYLVSTNDVIYLVIRDIYVLIMLCLSI